MAGLGTRAVTRTPGDYPRLVGLDCAQGNLWGTTGEKHKYSQRQVDVIDLDARKICTKICRSFWISSRNLIVDCFWTGIRMRKNCLQDGETTGRSICGLSGTGGDRTFIRMMKRF